MSTREILEAEMFWAQHDRPPLATGEGEGSHASSRGFDTPVRDGLCVLGCSGPLPRLAANVAPRHPGGALPFVR
jgi:hypothetical protein